MTAEADFLPLTGSAPIRARREDAETMEGYHALITLEVQALLARLRAQYDVDGRVGRWRPDLTDDLETVHWRFVVGPPPRPRPQPTPEGGA